MRRRLLSILPAIILLGLASLALWSLWQTDATDSTSRDIGFSMVGQAVSNISLPSFAGAGDVSLASWQGQPYAINVFASWCPPCRVEAPSIAQLGHRLPVIGINFRDEAAAALEFLELFGNPYAAIGVDDDGAASLALGVQALPETLIIDASGQIIFHQRGPIFADAFASDGDLAQVLAAIGK